MKDYSTVPNTTGSFPNVASQNTSGPGETDGTPYIAQVIDDLWGARQALMDRAGLVPSGVQETSGNSQFLQAIEFIIGAHRSRVKNWTQIPFTTTTDQFNDAAFVKMISGVRKDRWVIVGIKSVNSGIWSSRGSVAEWTERTNPASGNFLQAVIWDTINDLFIAVGNDDTTDADIVTSPDGITWTERSNPKAFELCGIASDGSGIIVAVGQADGTDAYIVTSANGTTWTEQSNPKNFTLLDVAYSPDLGLFCAVGVADGTDAYIVTSPDGSTWTERSNPQNQNLTSVAYGNGKFVAVGVGYGSTQPYMVESSDGVTWTQIIFNGMGAFQDAVGVVYSDELKLFVMVTGQGPESDGPPMIAYSDDGTNWEFGYLPIESVTPTNIANGENGFVIPCQGEIITSSQW